MDDNLLTFIGSIIVALITLLGVIITNATNYRKQTEAIKHTVDIITQKLEQITEVVKELKEHASDVPILRHRIEQVESQVAFLTKFHIPNN